MNIYWSDKGFDYNIMVVRQELIVIEHAQIIPLDVDEDHAFANAEIDE